MEQFEARLDAWIASHQGEIVAHAMDLIQIPSICKFTPDAEHPFGEGCAAALDYMLRLAGQLGLETRNYDYYAGAARLPGRTQKTIGIFVHLDTAPSSDMWTFRPFEPEVRNGYLIGIGAQDNKGTAVTMLYLLRCLRELEVRLEHTILLVFGCGKKAEMQDVEYFLQCEPEPEISLIADAGFPVCLGEKGSLNFEFRCPVAETRMVDFRAGRASNMVPDQAFALLKGLDYQQVETRLRSDVRCSVVPVGPFVKIAAGGLGGHAAFPEHTHSPIPVLAEILLENGYADDGSAPVLRFLRNTYDTCMGAPLHVDVRDEIFGYTTHVCGLVRMKDGILTQTVNIRYVPELDQEEIVRRVRAVGEAAGMQFQLLSNTPPHTLQPYLQPIASMLTAVANRVLGVRLHDYTMGGVTYAKKVPNAIAFGPNRDDLPTPVGIGRGSGHTADEVMRIQNLDDGLKIYALSLLRIDPIVIEGVI